MLTQVLQKVKQMFDLLLTRTIVCNMIKTERRDTMEKITQNKGIILFYAVVLIFVVVQMNRVEQINSSNLESKRLSYIIEK